MSNYICTLTNGCFENNGNHQMSDTLTCTSLIPLDNEFTISQCCFDNIQQIIEDRVIDALPPTPPETLQKQSKKWISIDKKLILTERTGSVNKGQQLSDIRSVINVTSAVMQIIPFLLQQEMKNAIIKKAKFSQINGLQTTTYTRHENKGSFPPIKEWNYLHFCLL